MLDNIPKVWIITSGQTCAQIMRLKVYMLEKAESDLMLWSIPFQ
jgi:hypothetical protein